MGSVTVPYYLSLDGIEGGSKHAKHKGEFECISLNFGFQQPTRVGGDRPGKDKDLGVTAYLGTRTKALAMAAVVGNRIKSGRISIYYFGEGTEKLTTTIDLKGLRVTSFAISTKSGGGRDRAFPTCDVSLNCESYDIYYLDPGV